MCYKGLQKFHFCTRKVTKDFILFTVHESTKLKLHLNTAVHEDQKTSQLDIKEEIYQLEEDNLIETSFVDVKNDVQNIVVTQSDNTSHSKQLSHLHS